ncbi:class I SAM-dependent methyltransferase [Candidatus Dependentiae bacterium]|nr:class I SAM-dependent methyltransferase [Candidatus Dependentiae bacterium]
MNKPCLTTYQKLCTEFYDLIEHPYSQQALRLYMNYAAQAQGPILEPMCGTGRFLIPMLQAGFDAYGFDASEHMLDGLKQKFAALSNKPAPVWQAFVENFSSDTRYQLIFVPYGSWGLITNLENCKNGLEIMYHHLEPGGKFVLEIETVASLPQPCGIERRGVQTRADGSKIVLTTMTSYNPESQVFSSQCRYDSIIDNQITNTEHEEFKQYLYNFDEMDQLLTNAGFIHIKKYQDHALNGAIDRSTHILIYECTK